MSAGIVYNNTVGLTATTAGSANQVLLSAGAGSAPIFGTAVVASGGTGVTSNTAYAVLCGGTTATGAIQSIAGVGTAGQVLTSNGAAALPTFQTITTPAATSFTAFASAILSNVTGDGTFYLVIFNSTSRNDSTIYNTGTGLVTVNRTGLWLFNTTLDQRGFLSTHTDGTILFEVNGGTQYSVVQGNPFSQVGSSARLIQGGSSLIALTSGDTVSVRYQVSGGTKVVDVAGAASRISSFSGIFMGT